MQIRYHFALGALALVHAATDIPLPIVPEVHQSKPPTTKRSVKIKHLHFFQDGVLGVRDWNATNNAASSSAAAAVAAAQSKTSTSAITVESSMLPFRRVYNRY